MNLQTLHDSRYISVSGTTDYDVYLTPGLPGEWVPTVTWVPEVSTGADGSNYRTLDVKQGSTAIVTQVTTASTGWTAGTPVALALISTAGLNAEFTGQTDVVKVSMGHAGTGATARGAIQVVWSRRNQ